MSSSLTFVPFFIMSSSMIAIAGGGGGGVGPGGGVPNESDEMTSMIMWGVCVYVNFKTTCLLPLASKLRVWAAWVRC